MFKFLFKDKEEFEISMGKVKSDLIKYIDDRIGATFYHNSKNSKLYHDIDFLGTGLDSQRNEISGLHKENKELKERIKTLESKLETILSIIRINK